MWDRTWAGLLLRDMAVKSLDTAIPNRVVSLDFLEI